MKKYIPNILTISRILASPILLFLGIHRQILLVILLTIFIALTDFLDGKLARKWQVTSPMGAKLDTIADKVLAFSLLSILIFHYHAFFYLFLFEFLIALFNGIIYIKEKIVRSLMIGKIKNWIMMITIILGYCTIFFTKLNLSIKPFIWITILFQIASLIQYINAYLDYRHRHRKKYLQDKNYYAIVKPILEHEEFLKRKEYMQHHKESVYHHVLRVSYDCYRLGKKLKLDYESLAIAGLLHDFYEKPWQLEKEKKPFFQKHGFTHAKNAALNAQKYFPELLNEKRKSMIKTHMFPLNITIPKYKESWLLTIIDKLDSIEFLFHPQWMLPKKKEVSVEKVWRF